jgi:hypothetical protein
MRAALLLVALGLGAIACTEPRSPRCTAVCRRESECTKASDSFDQNECVAACSALLNDDKNAAKVVRHIDCVNKQSTCPAVLECQ